MISQRDGERRESGLVELYQRRLFETRGQLGTFLEMDHGDWSHRSLTSILDWAEAFRFRLKVRISTH